jgi:hypothetical protein
VRPLVGRAAENLLCLVLLAALGALIHYPVVLDRAIPADLNALYHLQPWQELRPDDAPPAASESVESLRYYAWHAFLADSAARRDSLLWNPNELCGVPFAALRETRVYSPFSLPFYFLPLPQALQLSLFLKMLVAGWAAFYAARRFGLAPAPALLVGVAFELSGAFLIGHIHPVSDALPWVPLFLVYLDRLARQQYRYWPLGGLVLALILAGGAGLLVLVFGLVFLLIHEVSRSRRATPMSAMTVPASPATPKPRDARRLGVVRSFAAALAALGASAVLALLLLAVQLVPYVEWVRDAAPRPVTAPLPVPSLTEFIGILFPIFGDPAGLDPWSSQLHGVFYLGFIHTLLLGLWLAVRFAALSLYRRRIESLLLTAILLTVAGFAAAPHLGPYFHPGQLVMANGFVFALAGAAAIQEWVRLNAVECKRALTRYFLFLIPFGVAAAGAVIFLQRVAALLPVTAVAMAALLLVLFLALLAVTVVRPSIRIAAYGAGALIAAEALAVYLPRMTYTEPEAFFPETEFIRRMHEAGGRIGGGAAMGEWPLGVYGLAQMRGPAAVMPARYRVFADRVETDPLLIRRAASQALLLTKEDIHGPFATARAALRIRHVLPSGAVLFEDLEVKPRVWITRDWLPVPEGAPERIAAANPPVVETAMAPPAPEQETAANADRLEFDSTNSRVTVHAQLEQPGLLVLADTFYPGWHALIDGRPVPIRAVDSLFRGVEVGQGSHTVEFNYRPGSFRIGLLISAGAAAMLLLGILVQAAQTLRRYRKHDSAKA